MPRITKLEPQVKHPSRWSIFVDNRFFAGCSEEMMASLHLHVGDDLTTQRLDEIREALGMTKVRDSALRYLARRSRSESEMRKYLERKGFDSSQIDTTIAVAAGEEIPRRHAVRRSLGAQPPTARPARQTAPDDRTLSKRHRSRHRHAGRSTEHLRPRKKPKPPTKPCNRARIAIAAWKHLKSSRKSITF